MGGDAIMKRYLVFASQDYYSAGGWGDFVKDFGTEEEARRFAEEKLAKMDPKDWVDWAQIVDLETEKVTDLWRVLGDQAGDALHGPCGVDTLSPFDRVGKGKPKATA